MIALLLACAGAPEPPVDVVFVRDGVIRAQGPGRELPDGRRLLEQPWRPGEAVAGQVAPRSAECVPLYSVPLGDVTRWVARGGAQPDTSLAFSPGGEWLAVGTFLGEVLIVDSWSGELLARRKLSEAMVKRLAWSPSGDVLYVGEQSPDANLVAMDRELNSLWTVRLAERIGTSSPSADDLYGRYQLPGVYGLETLVDGSLLVAATHGWNEGSRRRNSAQLVKVSPRGEITAAWPEEPAEITLLHLRVRGDRVVVPLGRSATGPPPEGLPIGGVQVLDTELRPLESRILEPLPPYYESVFVWQAVDLLDEGPVVGLGDGRLVTPARVHPLGTPTLVGDVPIAAAVSHVVRASDHVLALTAGTLIPYGANRPELKPPEVHPAANTLHALSAGKVAWVWRGPHELQGLSVLGSEAVVGAGARVRDDRRDLFGALLFSVPTGELTAFCSTKAPVFFQQALSADRLVAVTEVPVDTGGELLGRYQLTVFR